MADWLRSIFWDNEVGNALLRVLIFVVPILLIVPLLIWWERRVLSWMQDRVGPNRVGPQGILQTICDGVKLFFKEDITPVAVDKLIYFTAPMVALFPAFALGGTLPWGPNLKLTPIADVEIGVLYILAISSLGVYGIVLAGYASNNKYSLMGGLRSSAQLISYELAMGMSVAAVVLATGSLKLTEIIKFQEGPLWGFIPGISNWLIFTPYGFVAAVIFAICVIAETNRAPFDLPEAENELIAGYHTEYSSMKFAVFFMGEYAAMFVFSGIFFALFFGGYHILPIQSLTDAPFVPYLAPLVTLGKMVTGITLFVWLRATLPRLRYDQLMHVGWKVLLPVGVLNFIATALWILATGQSGSPAMGVAAWFVAFVSVLVIWFGLKRVLTSRLTEQFGTRDITMVNDVPRTVTMVNGNQGEVVSGS